MIKGLKIELEPLVNSIKKHQDPKLVLEKIIFLSYNENSELRNFFITLSEKLE